MSYTIIDKRLNPSGKSLNNRQRFIKRAREELVKSVKESLQQRSITDTGDQTVSIPNKGIKEPSFRSDPTTGDSDYVVIGNDELVVGDLLEKPQSGKAGGQGQKGSKDGDGSDSFEFMLSKDEYLNILFEGLELPRLENKASPDSTEFNRTRAGYISDGVPANLDLFPTMKNSLGRRIALKRPKKQDLKRLEEELELALETGPSELVASLTAEIEKLKRKLRVVSYIDPIDLRYRNYNQVPKPKHKAVVFCIMDVSASMGAFEKDLAKRFYMLLHLFLQVKYKKVDVVFIRHHSKAIECSEDDFFHMKETGGTVVSEGFKLMLDIQRDRYPVGDWNIYVAQASDGDNYSDDNALLRELLSNQVLQIAKLMLYIEVANTSNRSKYYNGESADGLMGTYLDLMSNFQNFICETISDKEQVYSIFRSIFQAKETSK